MVNSEVLKDVIENSGLKMSFIADKLEITSYSLSKKINNVTEFKAGEIAQLCSLLKISTEKMYEIFFANSID